MEPPRCPQGTGGTLLAQPRGARGLDMDATERRQAVPRTRASQGFQVILVVAAGAVAGILIGQLIVYLLIQR